MTKTNAQGGAAPNGMIAQLDLTEAEVTRTLGLIGWIKAQSQARNNRQHIRAAALFVGLGVILLGGFPSSIMLGGGFLLVAAFALFEFLDPVRADIGKYPGAARPPETPAHAEAGKPAPAV